MLYQIESVAISDAFKTAWSAAGKHLQRVSQHQLSWLRAHLYQPMDHHLSFRIGNQLFFVFVEASGGIPFDEQSRNLLLRVAQQANGAACLMPMRTHAGTPVPSVQGWGLIDAHTGEPVDPPSLVSSELIIMTDWELMDFAVQIVRDQAEQQGHELASWQSNLGIDPSIWYVDGNDGVREWIVIRGTRWPVLRPNRPSRAADLAQLLRGENREGYFAWVSAGNADEPGDPSSPTPLYRGHALEVSDYGIEEL